MGASDGTLVEGVLRGDRAAFAELYDRRARLIRAVCFATTHDLDAAAELTQEVFLRAYAGLKTLRDRNRFAAWAVGIARQVVREWHRRRRRDRRTGDSSALLQLVQSEAPPSDDRLETMRVAVNALPERERLALQAFYLQGLDAEAARAVLGLSKSTFYRVLAAARERLAEKLRQQEVRR